MYQAWILLNIAGFLLEKNLKEGKRQQTILSKNNRLLFLLFFLLFIENFRGQMPFKGGGAKVILGVSPVAECQYRRISAKYTGSILWNSLDLSCMLPNQLTIF